SLAVTADAVTTILRDYHMPATKAADATNFLVSVVSQGKTHMEDLAYALSAILPTASALHVPLAQVGGAMATLTARGVPAADAAVKKVAAQIASGHGEVIGWKDVQADFNTQMDKAKFAIEAAGIKIGMILLPYVQQLLRTVVPMIPVIADWASKMATQLMTQI